MYYKTAAQIINIPVVEKINKNRSYCITLLVFRKKENFTSFTKKKIETKTNCHEMVLTQRDVGLAAGAGLGTIKIKILAVTVGRKAAQTYLKHYRHNIVADVPFPLQLLGITSGVWQQRSHMEHDLAVVETLVNRLGASVPIHDV